jgi:hypothetical protein
LFFAIIAFGAHVNAMDYNDLNLLAEEIDLENWNGQSQNEVLVTDEMPATQATQYIVEETLEELLQIGLAREQQMAYTQSLQQVCHLAFIQTASQRNIFTQQNSNLSNYRANKISKPKKIRRRGTNSLNRSNVSYVFTDETEEVTRKIENPARYKFTDETQFFYDEC